ncbi:alpha/beta fold hydrolase [Pseudonocardiaceae bacterium YIM PH 21723]|nr:alpha/beta fold hydrolase [Pseudonocardiaceae bacterium YIM PH 21723]
MYPDIGPYDYGMLSMGEGHSVYWEISGNPSGLPAAVLHGGPGSGHAPHTRRFFDPDRYRIVLLDQRGCGRSTPHASEPDIDLSSITTTHLVTDLERLREHLGIDRWLVTGGSWGCVLALAYAHRHPERVRGLVLNGLAAGRRCETDILTRGLGRLFPEAHARFFLGGDPAADYARLLADPDPAERDRAARAWVDWEAAIAGGPEARFDDPAYRLAFTRLVTHFWRHESWLEPDELLRPLPGIPAVLVQGELDFGNLVGTPWLLHRALPGSELILVPRAGHDHSRGIVSAVIAATDRFAEA